MPFLRRRPLLRAAAIGGGAYHMGRVRAESQAQDASQDERISNLEGQQQQAPAPAAAPSRGVSADAVERLTQLGKLHEQGVLTDEEFAQEKQKVLSA
jgi:Short C-terminal domain